MSKSPKASECSPLKMDFHLLGSNPKAKKKMVVDHLRLVTSDSGRVTRLFIAKDGSRMYSRIASAADFEKARKSGIRVVNAKAKAKAAPKRKSDAVKLAECVEKTGKLQEVISELKKKKKSPAKKSPAKKSPAKKSPAKKSPAKKSPKKSPAKRKSPKKGPAC